MLQRTHKASRPLGRDSTLFIVGAKGYVGSALFASAVKLCSAVGTSSSGGNGYLPLRLDAPAEYDYGKIRPGDVVFLTAAISAPDICAREHERAWAVNVTGTSAFISNVIEQGARVIFFSSDTVYGEREQPFDELAPCNPAGEYAVMKREVAQRFAGNSGFKALRLSYVFSLEDKFTRYLIGCAQKNEEAELFHPFCRAIVHRDDVVAGALALAQRWDEMPEQIINFGGPQVLSRVEFAECLREVHLHNLQFRVTQPDEAFFHNRPRVIAMTSPVFARLLGRSPHSLCEAARLEFAPLSNSEREE
jgi:nucleoside-diphosphate-sugar epimerase